VKKMAITTVSSRQFNQDASGAKNATRNGPVFITDRGRPAHVLLSIEEYCKITGHDPVDSMVPAEVPEMGFGLSRLSGRLYRPLGQS
jgi:prevent-host-death family protein